MGLINSPRQPLNGYYLGALLFTTRRAMVICFLRLNEHVKRMVSVNRLNKIKNERDWSGFERERETERARKVVKTFTAK